MVDTVVETDQIVVGLPHQSSLFKRYSKEECLSSNRVYRFQVALKGDSPNKTHFTSVLSPCLATVKEIRRDTGTYTDGISDSEILAWIYEMSQRVEDITSEDVDLDETTLLKTQKRWVRYQTNCELIETVYLGMAKNMGTFKKEIGDITISNAQDLPVLDTLLQRFKKKVEEAENLLTGGGDTPISSFVKASNTYTYTERGTF